MKRNLLCLSICLAFFSLSAHADWYCNVHNARGQSWSIHGWDKVAAGNNAMRVCIRNSEYAHNCVVTRCYFE